MDGPTNRHIVFPYNKANIYIYLYVFSLECRLNLAILPSLHSFIHPFINLGAELRGEGVTFSDELRGEGLAFSPHVTDGQFNL